MAFTQGRRDMCPSLLEFHQTSPRNLWVALVVDFSIQHSADLR